VELKELKTYWEQAQGFIKDHVGQAAYETWFSSIQAVPASPDQIFLEMPDDFFKEWVVEHYEKIIQESLNNVSAEVIKLAFRVNPDVIKKDAVVKEVSLTPRYPIQNRRPAANLNPRFSFDSFVVGPSNRFTHAACQAVAESPAKAYNPLFIYGKVGLGKTHLMQAVVQKIRQGKPDLTSCYITSERFTNELINAIQHHSTEKFRHKYREIDILLIDDIQFIAGKEATQEEFFHTFNALYDNHNQIVLSSDRPPKEIQHMEERLVSRFAWGLITDIQPPDYETRVAILRKKIEREPVKAPDDVIEFIAQQIQSNIRELEGALIRVVAYSLLEEKEICLSMAQDVLKDLVRETRVNISVEVIQKKVAETFNISINELKAKKRNKNIVLPRQIAMFLSRELTNLSLPEIGESFGGKDHTTILHAWNKIQRVIKEDRDLKSTVDRIVQGFKQ